MLTVLTYMRKISLIGQFFVTYNLNARKQDEENFEYLDFIGNPDDVKGMNYGLEMNLSSVGSNIDIV